MKTKITLEEMIKSYKKTGNLMASASLLGTSVRTMRRAFDKANIKIRTAGVARKTVWKYKYDEPKDNKQTGGEKK